MTSFDLQYKLLHSDAQTPIYSTDGSAGLDFYVYAPDDGIIIGPNQVMKIHTGVALCIPEHLVGILCLRSGISHKSKLSLTNGVGIIDPDYRGEIIFSVINHSHNDLYISHGTRIGQMIFLQSYKAELLKVESLSSTNRNGGFGHTGV